MKETKTKKTVRTTTTVSPAAKPETTPYELLEPVEEKVIRMHYGLSENDPLHNVHLFKLGMGAEIEDGYHFIKIINPVKYAIVNAALKCKSLLTGRDCSFVNLKGLEVKKSE